MDKYKRTAYTDTQREITAQRLKELREEKDVTFDEIAKATNVSKPTLQNWEVTDTNSKAYEGGFGSRIDAICEVAKYYNVSVAYLLGETDIKTPNVSMKAASKTTGLSVKAIEVLKGSPSMTVIPMSEQEVKFLLENPELKIKGRELKIIGQGVYVETLNAILEKNPFILSTIATFLMADSFELKEPISYSWKGKKLQVAHSSDLLRNGYLEQIKNEISILREMLEKERKGKNGK